MFVPYITVSTKDNDEAWIKEYAVALTNAAKKRFEVDTERLKREYEKQGKGAVPMDAVALREWKELSRPSYKDFAQSVAQGEVLLKSIGEPVGQTETRK